MTGVDRIIATASMSVSLVAALAILALSACAPVPDVTCGDEGCISSILEHHR